MVIQHFDHPQVLNNQRKKLFILIEKITIFVTYAIQITKSCILRINI
jgi:hypothetical protein